VINTPAAPPTQTFAPLPSVVATTVVPSLAAQTLPPLTATSVPPQPTGTPVPGQSMGTHFPQPTGTPVSTTRIPRTGLYDPEGFVRWYFEAVWKERNYQDLWDHYLTPSFKARPNAGDYQAYAVWWDSVERVDVNSLRVLQNDGTHAWIPVNVTLTMKDGRVIPNQEYDYTLFFDAARQTWMFDYIP